MLYNTKCLFSTISYLHHHYHHQYPAAKDAFHQVHFSLTASEMKKFSRNLCMSVLNEHLQENCDYEVLVDMLQVVLF